MGDSKRRKETLGEKYGQEEPVVSWLPLTKSQASQIQKIVTRSTWTGIVLLGLIWIMVRFIGPGLGWWHVSDV
ncbi:DUF2839 domain-containing protein [Thermosynechococcaceae cyanobacterium BACA0444]|uniref:DUF2839 domain-containing protein n=1 Tax=Pseudocalidococcus azoricus BACA0444 TaxID=2918990 RepID=A0AAE4FS77_9CYAN|nr:DUF2839 domain-containing protein [Pseudocalidococcus azoricus]MDS3861363.1 DUF2839 domain-containing protein [Pseudocalidococcus azoricus BACA0444]